jgi:hypothetical protein
MGGFPHLNLVLDEILETRTIIDIRHGFGRSFPHSGKYAMGVDGTLLPSFAPSFADNRNKGPLDKLNNFTDSNQVRPPGKKITPFSSPPGFNNATPPQLVQNHLQEAERDCLFFGNLADFYRALPVASSKFKHRTNRVLTFLRHHCDTPIDPRFGVQMRPDNITC